MLLTEVINSRSVLDISALTGIVIAALIAAWRRETVRDLKNSLQASEGAVLAWKEERDAAVAKADRLEEHVTKLEHRLREAEMTITRLEERTDLTRYFDEQKIFFSDMRGGMSEQTGVLKELVTSLTERR